MEILPNTKFDDSVTRSFGPLAQHVRQPLVKLRERIYQIEGCGFRMRIRLGTGHRLDFLVTLSRSDRVTEDLSDLKGEIGLGVLAAYNGNPLKAQSPSSINGWQQAFDEAAQAARVFCLPYLLGSQTELDGVKHFIEQKIEDSGIRTKEYHFPRKVREEWT
jgi:hypothetical protein